MSKDKKERGGLALSALRDVAIIAAAIIVASTFLGKDSGTEPVTKSVNHVDKVDQPSQEADEMGLSQPEFENHLLDYSKKRVAEINAAGPVEKIGRMTASSPKQNTLFQPSSAQSPQSPQPFPLNNTVTSTNPERPGGKGVITNHTFHPQPFVDEVSRQSILAIAQKASEQGLYTASSISQHSDGSLMSLAEKEENVRRALSEIPDEWTIVYKAPNEKVRAYVFTDPTCPFCAKLHKDIDKLNAAGVTVHYMLYPRDQANAAQGYMSMTATNLVNAWCSPDQKQAIDDMFNGYRIPPADCADLPEGEVRMAPPVPDHFQMGEYFKVTGTPTIFFSNGKSTMGYRDVRTFLSQAQ